jgi:hypothetical protein
MTTSVTAASAAHLDHVIFYGGYEMDSLFDFFERVGFLLTPLSRHSTGTVNRLAMLDNQYIEMIGFLPGTPKDVRPEIQVMPLGLNGVAVADVLGSPRRTHSMAFAEPLLLERPVKTPEVQGIAKFLITHVEHTVPDARAFLCRHNTPELLWVKAWMQHRNTAASIAEVHIPTAYGPGFKAVMDSVFDVPDDATNVTRPTYAVQQSIIHVVPCASRSLLDIRVRDLSQAQRAVQESGLTHTAEPGQITVPMPQQFHADLIFRAL